MAFKYFDRVQETSSTTGTGTLTLGGAVSGYRTFTSVFSDGDKMFYTITDQSGSNWEVGIGTFTASGTTLARTTVLASSNSGSAVNFTGNTYVFGDTAAAAEFYNPAASPNFSVQAQNDAHVPLVSKGHSSTQTSDLYEAQKSDATVLFSIDNHGRPVATADGTTTIAAGVGAGTSPTISITGNDVAGIINLTTGTSPTTAGLIGTVTFANAYGATPKSVIMTPASGASGRAQLPIVSSLSTSAWAFNPPVGNTLTASSTFAWYYLVIG